MDIKDSYLHGTVGVIKSIDINADKLIYKLADVTSTTRTITLPLATTIDNGLMSKEDKFRLDNIFTKFVQIVGKKDEESISLNGIYENAFLHHYLWNELGPSGNSIGSVINLVYLNDWISLIFCKPDDSTMYFRTYSGNDKKWYNWKQIAFTDSDITGNAASADKLSTTRYLWGQPFDGSGNVNGVMNFINQGNLITVGGDSWANNTVFSTGYDTTNGDWTKLGVAGAGSNSAGLILTNSGRVGIGVDYPTHKLHINGSIKAEYNPDYDLAHTIIGETHFYNDSYSDPAPGIRAAIKVNGTIAQSSGNVLLCTTSGNVGIGITTPEYKLDVNGSVGVRGAMDMKGSIFMSHNTALYMSDGNVGIYLSDYGIYWHNSDNTYNSSIMTSDGSITTIYKPLYIESDVHLNGSDQINGKWGGLALNFNCEKIVNTSIYNGIGSHIATFYGDSKQTRLFGNLLIGNDPNKNYIAFYGTTGDNVGGFNNTYIGENLWGSDESSELVLFKGNDVGSNAITVENSGPDRIRHIAGAHLFLVFPYTLSGTFADVCASTVPINILAINSGNIVAYTNLDFINDSSISWNRNTDFALIRFQNTSDGDINSYLDLQVGDNGDEYIRLSRKEGSSVYEMASFKADGARISGNLKITMPGSPSLIEMYPHGYADTYVGYVGHMSTSDSSLPTHGLIFNTSVCTSYNGVNALTLFNTRGSNYYSASRHIFDNMVNFTGAVLFANGTWNNIGNDVAIGDCNIAGMLGVKSLNNDVPGFRFCNSLGTPIGDFKVDNNVAKWNGNTILDASNAKELVGEFGYVMRKYTIDASALDENTWYPVTIPLGRYTTRIECIVFLDSGTTPSWSTHSYGFSVRKIWEVNGHGWGTATISRLIYMSDYNYATADPVRGIGQLGNGSVEYVHVRGGGKYFFYISHNAVPTLRTSTFTLSDLSISPTTTVPRTILPNVDVYQLGYYTSSTISNLPVYKQSVICTISASGTLGFADVIPEGRELHVIIKNTSNSAITITIPSTMINVMGENLQIDGNSYGELNILSCGSYYVRGVS